MIQGSKEIGSRIKQIRSHFKLTQQEMADSLGVTQTTISGIETKSANSSTALIKFICEKYRVNEEWLKNGSGEMFKDSGSGQAEGDLISRSALMRAMAGIALNTEADVRAWIEAEMLVGKAPAVTAGEKRFVRCDCCRFCAQSEEGEFWCRSLGGLGGELHPDEGDGCCRGQRMEPADPGEEGMCDWIREAAEKSKGGAG